MATKKVMCILLGVLAAVATTDLSAQEADPRIGTWKLNLAESTFDPGPPPKSYTRTYEDRGGGITLFTAEGMTAQGKPMFLQVAYKLDGKDYPQATTGVQTVSSISQELLDAYTVEPIVKTGGNVTSTGTQTVSKDGKTMTYRAKGTDAQGRPTSFVMVFEKQ
ncbi:MAG: hypothetical protein A2157_06575 [Deltaproteobacteria bacterium RBG_16_47_11]|nr:MAG: hypothetical protein A2157_06575 [Deltaproteobacteria bacterium RBG_16_47_11]